MPEAVRKQIKKEGNTYTLKTNEPNANTTYQSAIRTGDIVAVSGETKTLKFPSIEDLNLSVDKMKVKKEWVNDLDKDKRWQSEVTLNLTDGGGNLYKSITLNDSNNYTMEDNFISCGLAKIEDGKFDVSLGKGESFGLEVQGTDVKPAWSVANSSIATVSNDGTIKGITSGETTITAKLNDTKVEIVVRVK